MDIVSALYRLQPRPSLGAALFVRLLEVPLMDPGIAPILDSLYDRKCGMISTRVHNIRVFIEDGRPQYSPALFRHHCCPEPWELSAAALLDVV